MLRARRLATPRGVGSCRSSERIEVQALAVYALEFEPVRNAGANSPRIS